MSIQSDQEAISYITGACGLFFGLWGIGYMFCDKSYRDGKDKGVSEVREEAIAFGAAHRGPKGQFIWGPVTKRELEVAR